MQQDKAPPLVLVIDDDTFSQEFFSEMLEHCGVTDVHYAGNGAKALRTLSTLPRTPDLLICDIFMPDMDGIEFLDHLAKAHYTGNILLVSGEDVSMMAIAVEVAKANGLKLLGALTKPVSMHFLKQALSTV